ncbi:AVAST type 2 anti-phage system protein Avs2 [Candidatus Poriferisodalis sp.]|uniref:AVAST type 2 anti-phage system protein Avs2 n=1 Tax=Candidatus Poriferisodalis sp. TaxID=3101277 RepID=UPI003B01F68D
MKLRPWSGSQADGFEELCAQLADEHTPGAARFQRVGNPDGGVECYCEFADGTKWGWQAKFFLSALGDTQWRQLDRSVETALKAHPSLTRYFVCLPRNLSHAPRAGVRTTEKQKWQGRVAKWQRWARDRGRDVEFVFWGETQLLQWLSRPEHVGRREFWFGDPGQFSDEWLANRLDAAIRTAGPRYTPVIHVDLPVAKKFEVFGRTGFAAAEVRKLAEDVQRGLGYLGRVAAGESPSGGLAGLQEFVGAIQRVVQRISGHRCRSDEDWRLAEIKGTIHDALSRGDRGRAELEAAADAHSQRVSEQAESTTSRVNPYREALHSLDSLEGAAWAASGALREMEEIADSCLMLVTGQAGTGKTHLLCDVARRRIDERRPTVLLMGQQFTTNEPLWTQALQQLDLAHLSAEAFVGALESAAQASGCRALLMIDAVNEARDHGIWNAHLASFLAPIQASPWIGVVLSVRTTYAHHVLPDDVRADAAEVAHAGFAGVAYDAARNFFDYYGIEFPSVPLIRPEFNNPLFLKTLCAGLKNSGERRIPLGSEGISRVFDRYLRELNRQIAERLDVDPTDRVVDRALKILAETCIRNANRSIARDDVRDRINSLVPTTGFTDSLYRALVDVDLLSEFEGRPRHDGWFVTFGYEWFADHLMASYLVDEHADCSSLADALTDASTPEGVARWVTYSGLLDALCIHAAEQYAEELPSLLPGGLDSFDVRSAFVRSLAWRDPASVGLQCREIVDGLFADEHSGRLGAVFDALVSCATVPNHPLGAAYLHGRLRSLGIPDRDEIWSTYLHWAYGEQGPIDRVLDWAEQYKPETAPLDDPSRHACAVVLAWFLTASDRFVRDRATKGLVAILSNELAVTTDWVRRLQDVDDPYVTERVFAVAYGVAMRTTDADGLAPLAQTVYELVFAGGTPPVHILLRDYARGVIERAVHLGANLDIDADRIKPPYHSTWPHIPSSEELEHLDPLSGDPPHDLSDDDRARAWLCSSIKRSDFARYVIGTNSKSESRDWLEVALTEPPWRSADEVSDAFAVILGPIARRVFQKLRTRTKPTPLSIAFRDALGGLNIDESDEALDSYLDATVEVPYHDEQLERLLIRMLPQEHIARYAEVTQARGASAPRLQLDIIQRYVLWRVFDFGWTPERFGDFDRSTGGGPRHGTQKAERIGKKYQWIAYHEILALIADHYQYRSDYQDTGSSTDYQGPWQLSVRDIDPSVIVPRIERDRDDPGAPTRWWNRSVPIPTVDEIRHEDWLREEDDIPGRDGQLRFRDPESGTTWIKVHGFRTWESPAPLVIVSEKVDYRELWLDAYGYLVDADRVDEFLAWSRNVDFWNRWMTEPPEAHYLFFGELGWGPGFKDQLSDHLESQHPEPFDDGRACPTPLCPAAFSYSAETSGYDCSLTDSHEMLRSNSRLVDAMGMRWTGNGADFVDNHGTLVAFDPSTHDDCSSALLIREDRLSQYLEDSGDALVWAIVGEKRAREPGNWLDCWAASVRRSGAYVYGDDPSRGNMQTYPEAPTGDRTA